MAKKNLGANIVNIATGRKKTGKAAPKKGADPVIEKPKEVEEPKVVAEPTVDELAEQRVNDLLKDVDLKPQGGDDLLVLEEEDQPKTMEWLEEQVGALGAENERLRNEAGEAKENYKKLFERYQTLSDGEPTGGIVEDRLVPDSLVKNGAMALFEEFQNEYLRHPAPTRPHTKITLIALVQKMLEAFPFLEERRRI